MSLPLNPWQALVVVLTLTVADFADLSEPGLAKDIFPLTVSTAIEVFRLGPLIIVARPEYEKLPELATVSFGVTEIEELLLHANTSESTSTPEPFWRTCI